ncbi:MAG: hypothetical protein IPG38_16560 [Chitinophagaceae bacterium]|nr:hypothetical protein [Chitinophagaceae bacterium]
MALMLIPVFAASVLTAQTTAPAAAQPVTSGYNQLAVLLMIMIIVLAFVIWGMGQVLTALGKQLIHKNKAAASSIKALFYWQEFLCYRRFHLHRVQHL